MNRKKGILGALLTLIVSGALVGGVFIACDGIGGGNLPAVNTNTDISSVVPNTSREAVAAEQTDGTYRFVLTNGKVVEHDCDGITYRAPKQTKGGTTLEYTTVYEYFRDEAYDWRDRFIAAGVPEGLILVDVPYWFEIHKHSAVRFPSNLLKEAPVRTKS
jgi:hypothetical protein